MTTINDLDIPYWLDRWETGLRRILEIREARSAGTRKFYEAQSARSAPKKSTTTKKADPMSKLIKSMTPEQMKKILEMMESGK